MSLGSGRSQETGERGRGRRAGDPSSMYTLGTRRGRDEEGTRGGYWVGGGRGYGLGGGRGYGHSGTPDLASATETSKT